MLPMISVMVVAFYLVEEVCKCSELKCELVSGFHASGIAI